jgi:hypothetical protein
MVVNSRGPGFVCSSGTSIGLPRVDVAKPWSREIFAMMRLYQYGRQNEGWA